MWFQPNRLLIIHLAFFEYALLLYISLRNHDNALQTFGKHMGFYRLHGLLEHIHHTVVLKRRSALLTLYEYIQSPSDVYHVLLVSFLDKENLLTMDLSFLPLAEPLLLSVWLT